MESLEEDPVTGFQWHKLGQEERKTLKTNLQPAHPGEERVSGGGASGADRQDCAVLLLVHRRQAGNSSTRGFLAVHPPKYDSQSSRAKQSTKGTKKREPFHVTQIIVVHGWWRRSRNRRTSQNKVGDLKRRFSLNIVNLKQHEQGYPLG